MTKQEFIDGSVDFGMSNIEVVRIGGCKFFEPCPHSATHASSLDGRPLCAAHVDAYLVHIKAEFIAKAKAEAERYFIEGSIDDNPQDGEKENGESTELRGSETTEAPGESGDVEGRVEPVRGPEVPAGLGER